MTEIQFIYLLERIQPFISKRDINMRQVINAKIKLAISLSYLATGDSFKQKFRIFFLCSKKHNK